MSTSIPDVGSLFKGAHAEGAIGDDALSTLNVPDIGQQIQAGLGVSVDDVQASPVLTLIQPAYLFRSNQTISL